jgi:hypothetical protein
VGATIARPPQELEHLVVDNVGADPRVRRIDGIAFARTGTVPHVSTTTGWARWWEASETSPQCSGRPNRRMMLKYIQAPRPNHVDHNEGLVVARLGVGVGDRVCRDHSTTRKVRWVHLSGLIRRGQRVT